MELTAKQQARFQQGYLQAQIMLNDFSKPLEARKSAIDNSEYKMLMNALEGLNSKMVPVNKFFEKIAEPSPVKKISLLKSEQDLKVERKAARQAKIQAAAVARLAKKKLGI
jgi:Xaa-Pro aminopeptidase